MKILSRHSIIMGLLVLLFLAPGIAAIYFYQHPQWLMGHTTNRGDFVKPPVKIKSLVSSITGNVAEKKWHLILWHPGGCDELCIQPLEQLERIRLALGRHYYEIDQGLLTAPYPSKPISPQLLPLLQEHRFIVSPLSRNEARALSGLTDHERIFIVNPEGFLVLSYPITVNPDDVYHDLKQLMSTNKRSF